MLRTNIIIAGDASESDASWIEGVAVLAAVVVVVVVTAFNDWKKDRQFRGLKSKIEGNNKFNVIRKGKVVQVLVSDIVVGDLCQIKYGEYFWSEVQIFFKLNNINNCFVHEYSIFMFIMYILYR